MKHEGHNEIPPEGGGVIHVCSCGWRSRKCFSSAIASCEGMDHLERQRDDIPQPPFNKSGFS